METPVRARRKCGPKTKTGCGTCKIRRVKCDESKPTCNRCSLTGRVCDGYASSPKPTLSLVPNQKAGTTTENRGFQYFITQTASDLSGFYNSSFWQQLILQASSSEPSLRHAVIAIGALHEEFVNERLTFDWAVETKGQAFAVRQYTKAITHLRKSLAKGDQEPLAALMSCVLFVCFDSLRGFFDSALVHLRSGLKILRDLDWMGISESARLIVEKQIKPLFIRLSIQAILYVETTSTAERFGLVEELKVVSVGVEEDVLKLENMEDARDVMNRAVDGIFRAFYLSDGDASLGSQSPEVRHLFNTYTKLLCDWNKAFDEFLTASSSTLTSIQLRGAALLKIHYTVTNIMAEVVPSPLDPRSIFEAMNESNTFKRYNNDFLTVIKLSRSLMSSAEKDAHNGKPAFAFSTDLGLVGPLYYVCVRCQNLDLRDQAMVLLEGRQRREGMWDSQMGGKLIREFWKIEERYLMLLGVDRSKEENVSLGNFVDVRFKDGRNWVWFLKDSPEKEDEDIIKCLGEMVKANQWNSWDLMDENVGLGLEEDFDFSF